VQPEQYVTGQGWRTSRTKILDNALIGYCRLEMDEHPTLVTTVMPQITFDVAGYPPAKSEALSMLGVGHSHAPRVRLLLEAARRACEQQAFVPVKHEPVALDVVLRTPPEDAPSDATNYLGGIGDALEDKSRRGPLDHLGDLADVWLYGNDRQIKQVSYRQVQDPEAKYTVTVRRLR
jgi:hypothetical protein